MAINAKYGDNNLTDIQAVLEKHSSVPDHVLSMVADLIDRKLTDWTDQTRAIFEVQTAPAPTTVASKAALQPARATRSADATAKSWIMRRRKAADRAWAKLKANPSDVSSDLMATIQIAQTDPDWRLSRNAMRSAIDQAARMREAGTLDGNLLSVMTAWGKRP